MVKIFSISVRFSALVLLLLFGCVSQEQTTPANSFYDSSHMDLSEALASFGQYECILDGGKQNDFARSNLNLQDGVIRGNIKYAGVYRESLWFPKNEKLYLNVLNNGQLNESNWILVDFKSINVAIKSSSIGSTIRQLADSDSSSPFNPPIISSQSSADFICNPASFDKSIFIPDGVIIDGYSDLVDSIMAFENAMSSANR